MKLYGGKVSGYSLGWWPNLMWLDLAQEIRRYVEWLLEGGGPIEEHLAAGALSGYTAFFMRLLVGQKRPSEVYGDWLAFTRPANAWGGRVVTFLVTERADASRRWSVGQGPNSRRISEG